MRGLAAGGLAGPATRRFSFGQSRRPPSANWRRVVRADPARAVWCAGNRRWARGAEARQSEPARAPADGQVVGGGVGRTVRETAGRYQVDPLLVHSVIAVESNTIPGGVAERRAGPDATDAGNGGGGWR